LDWAHTPLRAHRSRSCHGHKGGKQEEAIENSNDVINWQKQQQYQSVPASSYVFLISGLGTRLPAAHRERPGLSPERVPSASAAVDSLFPAPAVCWWLSLLFICGACAPRGERRGSQEEETRRKHAEEQKLRTLAFMPGTKPAQPVPGLLFDEPVGPAVHL
jgi:hypothetical protein